jgi:hypothetical protein
LRDAAELVNDPAHAESLTRGDTTEAKARRKRREKAYPESTEGAVRASIGVVMSGTHEPGQTRATSWLTRIVCEASP